MPDIGPRVTAGLDNTNEILDQLFEEDIVLPKRVVGVDQKCMASHGVFLF
jgi:hypothetical protein